MLSTDLRTLGDQLFGRLQAADPLESGEIDGVIACVRDLERRAMAMECQPIEVVDIASRRPLIDAAGHYDGGRAWSRLSPRERDEAGGLAVELIVAELGIMLAASCIDRVPYRAAQRHLQDRLISLLAHVLPPDFAAGAMPPLPSRGVLPPRQALPAPAQIEETVQ